MITRTFDKQIPGAKGEHTSRQKHRYAKKLAKIKARKNPGKIPGFQSLELF